MGGALFFVGKYDEIPADSIMYLLNEWGAVKQDNSPLEEAVITLQSQDSEILRAFRSMNIIWGFGPASEVKNEQKSVYR